jgi:hypothetical protein
MITYIALFNSLFFNLTLNQKTFSVAFVLIFLFSSAINYLQEKYLRNKKINLIIKNIIFPTSIILLFMTEINMNLRFLFYPLPLVIALNLYYIDKIKPIDHLVYLTVEIFIFIISIYTWWNMNIPLALWVIYIFFNGMLIYERSTALKKEKQKGIKLKYENTLWIQNIFVLTYCISLIIYR